MPQFEIDLGDMRATFQALDSFTQGYIEAAFFTSTGPDNVEEGLGEASFDDIAPEALTAIIADCKLFQDTNAALLNVVYGTRGKYERADYDANRAGNDYWYTRNGHGTGFWDRGLGEAGDKLAAACRHHNVDMYRGDDGLIYFT